VSWQEDLQRMERDLATGRLSAEDYRKQRDELLAAANAGQAYQAPQTPQPQQQQPVQQTPQPGGYPGTPPGGMPGMPGTPPGGTPGMPQGTPPGGVPGQQAPTPFPPAFKWSTQQPSAQQPVAPPSAAESTQTIRPVGQHPPATGEATQVVPGAPGRDRTQAISGRPGDPERTQVVPGPYGGPQAGQPSPWGGQPNNLYSNDQMDSMPNWNTAGAFGDWPKQGPEVFESAGSGKRGKRIALIALIVVVLAGAGVGAWLLIGNKGSTQAHGSVTTSRPAPTTTTSQGPRRAIGSLVSPPGGYPAPQSFTPAQLTTTKPLSQPDLDILAQTSLSKADYVLNRDGTTVLDLWSFTVQDETAAKQLAKAFDTDQGRFGFQKTDITTKGGLYAAYTSQQQSVNNQNIIVYRLHYVVGNQVIRVEAFDADGTRARSEFLKLLNLQTKFTPPSSN
jgi:hypothetical protein